MDHARTTAVVVVMEFYTYEYHTNTLVVVASKELCTFVHKCGPHAHNRRSLVEAVPHKCGPDADNRRSSVV